MWEQLKNNRVALLIVCILIPISLGALAGIVTANNIPTWYAELNKPAFNPPNYLFGPVWTSLYILMGVSCFLVVRLPESKDRTRFIQVYAVQLALNFLWSFLFFYFHSPAMALVGIVLLLIAILFTIRYAFLLHKTAGVLLLPYLIWVSFATLLNAAIWMLN
ncbi:MAG: TspO/MBR family protein [Bacteroidia bacterium]